MGRDKSWDEYDSDIKTVVDEVNKRFAGVANWINLDSAIVKAMVWTEVMGGPTTDAWKKRPMQIGNAGDPGWSTLTMKVVKTDRDSVNLKAKVDLIAPASLITEMNTNGRDNPQTNIRAGVFWLVFNGARFDFAQADDDTKVEEHTIAKGDTISALAPKLKTTVAAILKDTGITMNQAGNLKIGATIKYHKAHMEWQIVKWTTWEKAVESYNGGGDANYMTKWKKNLAEIQGKP